MDEKRSSPRMRVRKAGTIAFGGAAIDCTVRNLTASGALLEVESPVGIPHRFVLVIPPDEVSRACRLIWTSERRVGVRFDRTDAASPKEKGRNAA
jgi:PilZ domain